MKKVIFFFIFLCLKQTAFSQGECCNALKESSIENYKLKTSLDSLSKLLDDQKIISSKEIRNLNDSIVQLSNQHIAEVITLNNQVEALKRDTTKKNQKIKKLDTKNIDKLERDVTQKKDSILLLKNILADTIRTKNTKIANINSECKNKIDIAHSKGQQEIYNKIAKEYESKDLDTLIAISTRLSIERDFLLIGNSSTLAKQKIESLKNYFDAKSVLDNRFDTQKVKVAQDQLRDIKDVSELSQKLSALILRYEIYHNSLEELKNKITGIDNSEKAVTEETQKRKFEKIRRLFKQYFENYPSIKGYPYLYNILIEIMIRKQIDANADIADLLSKL